MIIPTFQIRKQAQKGKIILKLTQLVSSDPWIWNLFGNIGLEPGFHPGFLLYGAILLFPNELTPDVHAGGYSYIRKLLSS